MKINEEQLRQIIRESVKEMLNTPQRNPSGSEDGRYHYKGTGSEESKERVRAIRNKSEDFYEKNHLPKPLYTDHGKPDTSEYDRYKKEYGKWGDTPTKGINEYRWDLRLDAIREFASKNYSNEEALQRVKYFCDDIQTKEGAKSFIAYLYQNGFKNIERS